MAKTIRGLVAFFMVIGTLFALTTTASAAVVFGGQPTVVSSSSNSNVLAVEQVMMNYRYVGTYVAISKRKVNRRSCFWSSGTWTNSLNLNGTDFKRYRETSRAKFCKLKKPIRRGGHTWYYVKVAGGLTNSPCYNLAVPPGRKQPRPQLRGRVLDLPTLEFKVTLKLDATSMVAATATCVSGTSWASASATGYGAASATVTINVKAKSRASARLAASVTIEQRQSVEISAAAEAKLNLSASATASCGGTVYVCPPGYTWNGTICSKDGTIGPGAGTPGQPGGPGAGGEPGNPTEGQVCRNTSGDIVSGPADQFGYCTT